MTVIFPLGIRQDIFLRLWDLAPMISMNFSITSIIIHKSTHSSNSPDQPYKVTTSEEEVHILRNSGRCNSKPSRALERAKRYVRAERG